MRRTIAIAGHITGHTIGVHSSGKEGYLLFDIVKRAKDINSRIPNPLSGKVPYRSLARFF